MGKRKGKNADRPKVNLVFDESKRKDFLCGFRKRKLERKKKAQEEMQRMMKDEVKRIKQENKESYKKLVVSSRPIPDIEQLLQEEYEDDDVNVKIVELSSEKLQKKNLFIGDNKPNESVSIAPKKEKIKPVQENTLHGMGSDEEEEEEEDDDEDEKEESEQDPNKPKTKKELKRLLQKQATKKIQKSKVFQMKSKLDRVKNKKKAVQKKGRINKVQNELSKNKNAKQKNKKKNVDRRKHK